MKVIKYLMWSFALSFVLISVMPAGANTYQSNGIIHWKGQDWSVSHENNLDTNGVWLDDQNRMHLIIKKNENGEWKEAEVGSQRTFLYGTFTWTVASPVYTFDRNSVVGLFTYADEGNNELDIEASTWGKTGGNNLWYTVQPGNQPGNQHRYLVPSSIDGTNTKYRIEWKPNYVRFTSWQANGKVITDYNYTNVPGIPKKPSKVKMNLWLTAPTNGPNMWLRDPPSDGQDIELIISDFKVTDT